MCVWGLWPSLKTQRALREVAEFMWFFSLCHKTAFNRASVRVRPDPICFKCPHTHTHTHTHTAQGDFHPEIYSLFFSSGERYSYISLENHFLCVCVCVCVWKKVRMCECFKCSLITFQWHSNPLFSLLFFIIMFNLGCLAEWHWNITFQMNALFTFHVELHAAPVTVIAWRQIEARVSILHLYFAFSALYYSLSQSSFCSRALFREWKLSGYCAKLDRRATADNHTSQS